MVHGGSAASGGDGKHPADCAEPASSEEQLTSAHGPFQKCPAINERFPGATGVILLQLIWIFTSCTSTLTLHGSHLLVLEQLPGTR